jgi:hypothetical protein
MAGAMATGTVTPTTDAQKTVVIFDCESDGRPRSSFGDTRALQDFQFVQCTCACALIVPATQLPSLAGATKLTCWRDVAASPGANPFEPLFEAFDAATVIVGYNALDFDFPLLHKHYARKHGAQRYLEHRVKCLDLFSRLRAVSNEWPKLDNLLMANGLPVKIGDGKQAIRMWQRNEREELEAYCEVDVLRTAELSLRRQLVFGKATMPEHVYGLMPMLTAVLLAEEEGEYVVV